ncbi:AlpA family phage regulatory protein [Methylobacterium sp. W2]|uniref:helix-turn-helix transcriptional regulator n=1 Tax=Methylobacterium sp. W2 TaxID=2598107 RepID=UPI001D0CC737|nr:AlpA family phage regulatory protein [Methylobacterium sp. W2]MCC0806147.1 AlpA family phage regulatory protein [Methylobacterium sp. W2]
MAIYTTLQNDRPADGLPLSGFVRLSQILAPSGPVPACRSTIYAWIQAGAFPAPHRVGPGRIAGFRVEDVRAFLANPCTAHTAAQGSVMKHSTAVTARLANG